MAKIWEPLNIEVYKSWCEAIQEEASDDLNDWEISFIESIYQRLNKNQNLTENQDKKLEDIYAAKTK